MDGIPLIPSTTAFGRCYAATVGPSHGSPVQWTCVMSAKDSDSDSDRDMLMAQEATPKRVASLRRMLKLKAPRIEPLQA